MKAKRFLSMFLVVVLMFGIMVTPAHASSFGERGPVQFQVPAEGWSGTIWPAYNHRDAANDNVRTLYTDKANFPVKVILNGSDRRNTKTYTFDDYGTYYLEVEDVDGARVAFDLLAFFSIIGMGLVLRDTPHAYATVTIAPHSARPDNNAHTQTPPEATQRG